MQTDWKDIIDKENDNGIYIYEHQLSVLRYNLFKESNIFYD